MWKSYLYLAAAIVCEVAWAVLLKYTEQLTRPVATVITLVAYFGALYFLTLTVKSMPVGVAYALWAGTGMVLIALLGVALHKEQLDLPAVIGLILILAGVLIINLFSKSVTH